MRLSTSHIVSVSHLLWKSALRASQSRSRSWFARMYPFSLAPLGTGTSNELGFWTLVIGTTKQWPVAML